MTSLARLTDALAVKAALDEFLQLGRTLFLERYGYGKSRDYMVRHLSTGDLCDSKAIVGAAFGHQYPSEGPMKPEEFSGGEATVVPTLRRLGFDVVRIGEDWTDAEVNATVEDYFDMLRSEARQDPYNKSEHNTALRSILSSRTKSSVELKHQNISAVLNDLGMPYISGYKPRGNSQLLLRKAVQEYVLRESGAVQGIVDALEDVKLPGQKTYSAVLVDPPPIETFTASDTTQPRTRLPRKIDFASRDEVNRKLGRAGEQWVLGYEQQRLVDSDQADLYAKIDWVSDRLGDGAGFDILSFDAVDRPRYIEVKTTNGAQRSSFIVSRNELEFSRDVGDLFYLYRVFAFRQQPRLFVLQGDISRKLHLEALDYRASFRKLAS